jgi:hypothetical protein
MSQKSERLIKAENEVSACLNDAEAADCGANSLL